MPLAIVGQRLPYRPLSRLQDHPGLLQQPDKLQRRDQPVVGIVPICLIANVEFHFSSSRLAQSTDPYGNTLYTATQTLAPAQQDILNATNTIQKNSESINTLEVNIKKLESEIAVINMKMPALEEEKKSFVSAKNFKEAGRVSNELKAFLENKTKNLSLKWTYYSKQQ